MMKITLPLGAGGFLLDVSPGPPEPSETCRRAPLCAPGSDCAQRHSQKRLALPTLTKKGEAMSSRKEQLQEVYANLGLILQRPEAFGLGASAPEALVDSLKATLEKLGRALETQELPESSEPEEDLAVELSQDADHASSPSCCSDSRRCCSDSRRREHYAV